MQGFDNFHTYDANGVYELELSNGNADTFVVTQTKGGYVEGYRANAHDDHTATDNLDDPVPEGRLNVYDKRWQICTESIVAKRFVGGFRDFESYRFADGDAPLELLIDVPEDKRDDVDYDYNVVECPSCDWEDDVERAFNANQCPECGTVVVGENRGETVEERTERMERDYHGVEEVDTDE